MNWSRLLALALALLAGARNVAGADLPSDVAAFLKRAETCVHFAGEEPYDDARRTEISLAMDAAGCRTLESDAVTLLSKHAGNADATSAINLDVALDYL